MIQQQLPPFYNVVAAGKATLRVPNYQLTLNRLVLRLGGTSFTKAMITDISLKLGVRTVYNITGTNLDKINKYKGIYDSASFLTIDFTERDAPQIVGKEIGGYDLKTLGEMGLDLTVEVTIAGATAPTLSASGWFGNSQKNAAIMKLLYIPASSSVAGKFPINFNPMGALIKRVHYFYSGTDWTGTANGNINRVEVKKSGLVVWDQECLEARFVQQEYRKVPQSKLYTVDFIVDNNTSSMLYTRDATSLEFNTYLTAADGVSAYVELLDNPLNV